MNRRAATPAGHYALTITALAITNLAFALTPGTLALPIAALTYLAVITGTAWALRWHIPTALTATTLALRLLTATALRILIHLLTLIHAALTNTPAAYATAA